MSQETIIANTEVSFKDFLFKNKRNRTILWIAAVAIVIQFGVFKYFYPFASYIHGDSFSYINSAYENLTINTYLIGYSKFLRLFSVFSKSDLILTAFQYLMIQASALFLLFTLFFFYKSRKTIQLILLILIVFNPLFLHLGNLVSSDGFFLALSMIWFAILLWITQRPSNKIILWHSIVLFIAFTVRYNAMIYPFIAAIAFWISNLTIRKKVIGFGLSILLCGLFAVFTSYQYKKLTGYWQYSPFSGWQFANNAMYTYRYVNKSDRNPVPKKFEALDKMIREYFDSTRDTNKFPVEKIRASTYYMWSRGLPLMKYRDSFFKKQPKAPELKKWASMGPLYKSYGIYIIKQYPWHFLKYFIWPNALKYYAPPEEFLESYNSGKDGVTVVTKKWFGYENQKVKTRMKTNNVIILSYFPILSGIANVVMLCSIFCYILLKGWHQSHAFQKGVLIGSAIWLLNAAFTITASSAALRFQSFPITITTIYTLLLIGWMIDLMATLKHETITNQKKLNTALQHAVV
jgi:hypothetical protein